MAARFFTRAVSTAEEGENCAGLDGVNTTFNWIAPCTPGRQVQEIEEVIAREIHPGTLFPLAKSEIFPAAVADNVSVDDAPFEKTRDPGEIVVVVDVETAADHVRLSNIHRSPEIPLIWKLVIIFPLPVKLNCSPATGLSFFTVKVSVVESE